METIVFLERGTFAIEFPRPSFAHEWIEFWETQPAQIVERLRDATIAIVNKLPMRAETLSQLAHLKLIAVAATGVDNIDLDFCRTHGIKVCNARNYAGHSLPEHVLMLMLALRRNLIAYHADVRNGEWQRANQFCLLNHPIRDVSGQTLGIVGFGFLGRSVATLAKAIGMKVLVAEHRGAETVRPDRIEFSEVLKQSDVVSLHCPLTQETRNLIGEAELRMMKQDALFINTARGALVNAEDLLRALKENWIGGAAVDVLAEEPPRNGNVLLSARLPNLIVTPHIAWASKEAMQTLAEQLMRTMEEALGIDD